MNAVTDLPYLPAAPALEDCSVVELRDYTLRPGQRDVLVELFEREFVEPQEACGMRLVAQFRDLDRPEHFVWMPVRTEGHALVWLARLHDAAAWHAATQRLADMPAWTRRALPPLERSALEPFALRRLQPTRRSLLR